MNLGFFESNVFPEVLRLLSDGQVHSGEELGMLLGVSRAAVWKTLKKFELVGLDVISIKGKGYCIKGGLDLLDESEIQAQFQEFLDIKVFAQVDSTNSYLLRQNNPERKVCLAESQTAGRGRRGRAWVSPFAQNLYLSIGWGFEGGIAVLEGLSLVVGLALVRSLRRCGVCDLQVKWPNDILYKDRKLGGVLIEINGDPAGYCVAVIGIGLNVSMRGDYASSIEQPWSSLDQVFDEQNILPVGRNRLASHLLSELNSILSRYQTDGFSAYKDEWISIASYLNQSVYIHKGNHIQQGIFCGIDDSGALVLEADGSELVFHGGEVSLRREYVS